MKIKKYWDITPIIVIRWIIFLPITFVSVYLLHALPILAVKAAFGYRPEITFGTIILAVITVSILGSLCLLWLSGLFISISLSCYALPSNTKIGSVVFGTAFTLYHGELSLAAILIPVHWSLKIYHFIFLAIVICCTVVTYRSASADEQG